MTLLNNQFKKSFVMISLATERDRNCISVLCKTKSSSIQLYAAQPTLILAYGGDVTEIDILRLEIVALMYNPGRIHVII